jgi:hypothetical protein
MAIGVTRAALRLAPGAVNRSGERGVRGFRSSRTQQCEEGDPDGRERQEHFIACGRNGEKFDRALPPYSMERISISWSPTKTISPAALPIGARVFAQVRQNPRGMPADYTFRSRPALAFSASGKSHIPSEVNLVRRYSV